MVRDNSQEYFIVSAFLRPTYMMANHYVDYVHGQIAGRFKNTGLKKHDSMWKAVGALSHEMLRMFDKYGLSIPIPTNLVIRIPSLTRLLLPEKRTDYSRVLFASSYFAKAVGEEKVAEKDPFTNIPISLWVVMKLVDADVLNYDNELGVSNYHRQGTRLQPEVVDQIDQQWLENYCLMLKKGKDMAAQRRTLLGSWLWAKGRRNGQGISLNSSTNSFLRVKTVLLTVDNFMVRSRRYFRTMIKSRCIVI